MLCSIFGNIKIVSLPKFELIWTMGSVSRMLLISPNFSLALWPRTNRSSEKPHFLVDGWPIGQFSTWSRSCWWFVNLEFRKSARCLTFCFRTTKWLPPPTSSTCTLSTRPMWTSLGRYPTRTTRGLSKAATRSPTTGTTGMRIGRTMVTGSLTSWSSTAKHLEPDPTLSSSGTSVRAGVRRSREQTTSSNCQILRTTGGAQSGSTATEEWYRYDDTSITQSSFSQRVCSAIQILNECFFQVHNIVFLFVCI